MTNIECKQKIVLETLGVVFVCKRMGYKPNGKHVVCWVNPNGSNPKDIYWSTGDGNTYHRISYESCIKKLSKGHKQEVHHRCEIKGCIRPKHLQALACKAHKALTNKNDPSIQRRSAETTRATYKKNGAAIKLKISKKIKQAYKVNPLIQKDRMKLKAFQVRKIRKLAAKGFTNKELGAKYSVSGRTIQQIIEGKTYKFVL